MPEAKNTSLNLKDTQKVFKSSYQSLTGSGQIKKKG